MRGEVAPRKMVCPVCGNEFVTTRAGSIYCSKDCKNKASRERVKHYTEDEKPKNRIRTCPGCGKQFTTPSANRKYCSDECRREAYREAREEEVQEVHETYKDRRKKLWSLSREATEAGMSYGEYVARRRNGR